MRNPRFEKLLEKVLKLHNSKNTDYAEEGNPYSNFEFAAQFAGITVPEGFDYLIGVKQARLVNLRLSEKDPCHESIQDSLLDRAVYACLAASYDMEDE